MSDIPQNRGFWRRMGDIFGISSDASAHNCYGLGNQLCIDTEYRKDNEMHPAKTINELKPESDAYWHMFYWQEHFLAPVYQPKANSGANP